MAFNRRKVPTPSASAVYSDISNETLTCDMAPKLYTSAGRTVEMMWKRFELSVRSP